MQIHFGPDHDGLHVDPARPGAYEWWYFDALSDDDRYALVVIFFLGSPMSPYYKAVVNGKEPDPRDWCGVFVSLHEKQADRWAGRAYAYNLYRGGTFAEDGGEVAVGGSRVVREETGESALTWHLTLNEPGLWFGRTRADVTFTVLGASPNRPPLGEDDGHTWACVAPVCRVEGEVNSIQFSGLGYHDHNFGQLPWADTDTWYWGRAVLPCSDDKVRALVYYHVVNFAQENQSIAFVCTNGDVEVIAPGPHSTRNKPEKVQYTTAGRFYYPIGFSDIEDFELGTFIKMGSTAKRFIQSGPFYQRYISRITGSKYTIHEVTKRGVNMTKLWQVGDLSMVEPPGGVGIGEIFRPARLCGPIASRAMWTRIRRRGAPGK